MPPVRVPIQPIMVGIMSIDWSAKRSISWRSSDTAITSSTVGHDWGASLAWQIADQQPQRLASLTILSRPQQLAFGRALEIPDGEQRRRSGHHWTFLELDAGPNILVDNANWLRTGLTRNGVPPAAIEAHLSVIGNPQGDGGGLAWYGAQGVRHQPAGPTKVPTQVIWGDQDDTDGRAAAEGTAEFTRTRLNPSHERRQRSCNNQKRLTDSRLISIIPRRTVSANVVPLVVTGNSNAPGLFLAGISARPG